MIPINRLPNELNSNKIVKDKINIKVETSNQDEVD